MLKSKKKIISIFCVSLVMLSVMECAPKISLKTNISQSSLVVSAATTYDWSAYLKKSSDWYGTSEAITLAEDIVKYQLSDGGWKKDMAGSATGSWGKSTTDNDATTSQIIILARIYNKTKNSKYLTSCQKGIDLLLNGQYSNGGWPQVFNDAGTYHAHITYNDGAMVRVLNIIKSVSEKSGDFSFIDDTRSSKAKTSMAKGIECILNTQIIVNGTKTAWCQQHDEITLKAASARAYELPSICTSESVGIVNFLKSIKNPSSTIVDSINSAVIWMTKVQINGIKVVDTGTDRIVQSDPNAAPIWARFYEMGTNKAMFVDRDSSVHYQLSEISLERRTGYSWYGSWPKDLVNSGTITTTPAVITVTTTTTKPLTTITQPVTTTTTNTTTNPVTTTQISLLNGTLIKSLKVNDTENASDWSIQYNLQEGNIAFGDRAYTFTSVADSVRGAEWIRTACDSKAYNGDLASFKTESNVIVYVALDTRITIVPQWLNSWTLTRGTITDNETNPVTLAIYYKEFNAGNTIVLGNNGGTGAVNYVVAVKPKEIETTVSTTPITTTTTTKVSITEQTTTSSLLSNLVYGDITGDTKVNNSDLVSLSQYLIGELKLSEESYNLADVSGDGNVDVADLALMKQYLMGDSIKLGK